jgi:aldose sugar dehydrogenase
MGSVPLNILHWVFLFNAMSFRILITFLLLSSFFFPFTNPLEAYSSGSQSSEEFSQHSNQSLQLPKIFDIDLKADIVFRGLDFPTSMTFLGPNDILVLEKNRGTVQRILNGEMLREPLLDVNVSKFSERGMLGIDVEKNEKKGGRTTTINVFLYFTESLSGDEDNQTLGNFLYKYDLVDNKLINPKRLLDLPSSPGPAHNGGKVKIGPDNNVYFTVGNLNLLGKERFLTRAENLENGENPDGRAGILRMTQDGLPIPNGALIGDEYPLNLYYAYGIRNSFGIDFDPLTGNLWDTENGPKYGDEINLVEPGFNSGWWKVQGLWKNNYNNTVDILTRAPSDLVSFNGKGNYSDPEFEWRQTVGPTALKFLNSDKLGKEYENDMFVGDFHKGNIYHFDLTNDRMALEVEGLLKDKIANSLDELKTSLFGQGFGGITDMEVGPDGYLYVLALYQGGIECTLDILDNCISYGSTVRGTIFRIVPDTVTSTSIG